MSKTGDHSTISPDPGSDSGLERAHDGPFGRNGCHAARRPITEPSPFTAREGLDHIRDRIESGHYESPLLLDSVARRVVESGDLDRVTG